MTDYTKDTRTNPKQNSAVAQSRERLSPAGQDVELLRIFKGGDKCRQELYDVAESFATRMKNVEHHQIRNLLDLVIWARQSHTEANSKDLNPTSLGRIATLRPRFAYMAARKSGLKTLQQSLEHVLKDKTAFITGHDVNRLYDFIAAIVAYHKSLKPRES